MLAWRECRGGVGGCVCVECVGWFPCVGYGCLIAGFWLRMTYMSVSRRSCPRIRELWLIWCVLPVVNRVGLQVLRFCCSPVLNIVVLKPCSGSERSKRRTATYITHNPLMHSAHPTPKQARTRTHVQNSIYEGRLCLMVQGVGGG